MLPEFVYKIAPFDAWDTALEQGIYEGAPVDLEDGFIHFSTASQVRQTAAKHFAGQDNLMLIKVATAPDARHYKMKPSRGGDLFPHLYCPLPVSSAVEWQELPLGKDGQHMFPSDLPE